MWTTRLYQFIYFCSSWQYWSKWEWYRLTVLLIFTHVAEKFLASLVQELYNSSIITTQMTHKVKDTMKLIYIVTAVQQSQYLNTKYVTVQFYTPLHSNMTGFQILRFIHDWEAQQRLPLIIYLFDKFNNALPKFCMPILTHSWR